jgi:hypothetical protein
LNYKSEVLHRAGALASGVHADKTSATHLTKEERRPSQLNHGVLLGAPVRRHRECLLPQFDNTRAGDLQVGLTEEARLALIYCVSIKIDGA